MSYFERFRELEGAGILDASSNVDLFCLHATFVPEIRDVQARHYRGVTFQKKRKSTKDPAYPAGTHRRRHLYVNQPSLATELTEDQAQRVAAAGTQYWEQNRPASLRPRP